MTTAFSSAIDDRPCPLKLSFVATLRMHRVRGKPPFAPAVCRQGEYAAEPSLPMAGGKSYSGGLRAFLIKDPPPHACCIGGHVTER